MAKSPKILTKFNVFNIRFTIYDTTDIDISTIRQMDISVDIIIDIEINHITNIDRDLDDYRHEIISNRRSINGYKDSISIIDFNNREVNNNSSYTLNRKDDYNREISIISNCIRKTSIVSIHLKYRENDNKSTCIYKSLYTKNGVYKCKRGANIINNSICHNDISIISKNERENNNTNISIRGYNNYRIYNCKRGATESDPRGR